MPTSRTTRTRRASRRSIRSWAATSSARLNKQHIEALRWGPRRPPPDPDAFMCRERTNRQLTVCCPTPINHDSRVRQQLSPGSQRKLFQLCFQRLVATSRGSDRIWHDGRNVDDRADAQTSIQLNILTHWRIQMEIENLNKDLDKEAQKQVKGGLALTGQVVPTNVQSNELLQNFDIASNGPVAIANDADQSNDSSQPSFVPVGSLFVGAPYLRN